ncbi:hypothetical protein FRX31_015634 [Thalictrum thalictroides]|uniref:Uncharacterized protein n=1 Tax=Thalictrum thalictroides TaxID=46969 RepID=A0A7J6WBN7_THATH|nr:hypothetical protein FRX31_015634 [Thalictrum thalictroides]
MSRIDRCLVNSQWFGQYFNSEVEYLPFGFSDHSPGMLYWTHYSKKAHFKFYNSWTSHPEFLPLVKSI